MQQTSRENIPKQKVSYWPKTVEIDGHAVGTPFDMSRQRHLRLLPRRSEYRTLLQRSRGERSDRIPWERAKAGIVVLLLVIFRSTRSNEERRSSKSICGVRIRLFLYFMMKMLLMLYPKLNSKPSIEAILADEIPFAICMCLRFATSSFCQTFTFDFREIII